MCAVALPGLRRGEGLKYKLNYFFYSFRLSFINNTFISKKGCATGCVEEHEVSQELLSQINK